MLEYRYDTQLLIEGTYVRMPFTIISWRIFKEIACLLSAMLSLSNYIFIRIRPEKFWNTVLPLAKFMILLSRIWTVSPEAKRAKTSCFWKPSYFFRFPFLIYDVNCMKFDFISCKSSIAMVL